MYNQQVLNAVEAKLLELDAANYRYSFDNSVGTIICDVIKRCKEDSRPLWDEYCSLSFDLRHNKVNGIAEMLGGDVFALFVKVYENSKKEGCFEMPSNLPLD